MKAAVLTGIREIHLEERATPSPSTGELLLRMRAVSVCGSDLHHYLEGGIGPAVAKAPAVLGHEVAAEVIDTNGPNFGLKVGSLVAVDPARPCGTCEWCRSGHRNLCPHDRFAGSPPQDGALMEYVVAPLEAIIPVPTNFDAETTALLEPLGIALHALGLAKIRPLESVAILGAGPIGLLLLQVARVAGAGAIHVVDPLTYRLKVAEKVGADSVHEERSGVREATDGRGVDVVVEATNSPLGPQHAAEVARIGGRIVLVGIPEGDNFSMTASVARLKGLTVKWSRRMADVYPRAIQLVKQGRVNLPALITHRFPLSRTAEAFAAQAQYADGIVKSIIVPD